MYTFHVFLLFGWLLRLSAFQAVSFGARRKTTESPFLDWLRDCQKNGVFASWVLSSAFLSTSFWYLFLFSRLIKISVQFLLSRSLFFFLHFSALFYLGSFIFPSFFFSIYIWYCMQLLIDWQVGITWARPKSKWVILQVCFCLLPIFVFVLNIIGNGMASLCKIWLFSFSFLFCSDLCWFIIACAGFGSEFNSIWGK